MSWSELVCDLSGGGSITLEFDVEWLSAPLADVEFARGLAAHVAGYTADYDVLGGDELSRSGGPFLDDREAADVVAALILDTPPAVSGDAEVTAGPVSATVSSKRRGLKRGETSIDYVAVAECYKQAVRDGRRISRALMDEFGVEESTAKNWPAKCRLLGLLPALGEPIEGAVAPRQFVPHRSNGSSS